MLDSTPSDHCRVGTLFWRPRGTWKDCLSVSIWQQHKEWSRVGGGGDPSSIPGNGILTLLVRRHMRERRVPLKDIKSMDRQYLSNKFSVTPGFLMWAAGEMVEPFPDGGAICWWWSHFLRNSRGRCLGEKDGVETREIDDSPKKACEVRSRVKKEA